MIHYREVDVVSTLGETAVVRGLENGVLLSTKILNLYDGAQVKVPELDSKQSEDSKKKKG